MTSIRRRKALDKRTYNSKTPKKTTSYDISRSETDTPQEIREAIEPEGQMKRAKEAEQEQTGE